MPGLAELALPAAYAVSIVEGEVTVLLAVENLRRALAILLRYLASLALANYQRCDAQSEDTDCELEHAFAHEVGHGDGAWLHIAAVACKPFLRRPTPFLADLPALFWRDAKQWGPLRGQLGRLVELRNKIHEAGHLDEAGASHWLAEALPAWRKAIGLALPLLRVRLFYLEQPYDVGREHFSYVVRWLMGEHFVPRAEITTWSTPLRKGRLYLASDDDQRFLDLDPFLQYERCEITRAREVYSVERQEHDALSLTTFRFHHILKRSGVRLPFVLGGRD